MRAGPVSKKCSRGKIHHRDTEDTEKIGVPAKAGIHFSDALAADGWVPAFAGTPVVFLFSVSHRLIGEIGYFTEEKLVGARNEFATRCTIGPFASVSARWRCHSGSA